MARYWACALTYPRQEKIALANLERQHFKAFYPYFMVPGPSRHSTAQIARAAFPSYIFVELDDRLYNWSPINFTLGIRRLLTYAGAIDEYRRPCKADFVDTLWNMRILQTDRGPDLLPIGTSVKIMRGPFSERVALVEMSTATRVKVLLEVFNRDIHLEFAIEAVEQVMRPVA